MFTAVTSYLAEERGECWRVLDRSKKCIIDKSWPGALRLPTHSEYQYKDERGELVLCSSSEDDKKLLFSAGAATSGQASLSSCLVVLLSILLGGEREREEGSHCPPAPTKQRTKFLLKKIFSQEKMLMTEAVVGVVKDSADDNSDNFTSPTPPTDQYWQITETRWAAPALTEAALPSSGSDHTNQ